MIGSLVLEVLIKFLIWLYGSIRLLFVIGFCWFVNVLIKLFCMYKLVDIGVVVLLILKEVLDKLDLCD